MVREHLGKMHRHLLTYLKLTFLVLFQSYLYRRKKLFLFLVIPSLLETFSLVIPVNSRFNQDAKTLRSQLCVKSYSIKKINNQNAGKKRIRKT